MALEVMKTVSHYLGLALAQVALTVDPEIFVIGGGVSKAGQFLIDMIQKDYDHFTPISENKANSCATMDLIRWTGGCFSLRISSDSNR